MADAAAEAPAAAVSQDEASEPKMSGALQKSEEGEKDSTSETKPETKNGNDSADTAKQSTEKGDRLQTNDWREMRDKDSSRGRGRYDNRRSNYRGRDDRAGGQMERDMAKNKRKNIISDLTTQKESSDPVEIRKQVEFYFSDSNLPTDPFLLGKVEGPKNTPVEISVIHSFKRMRHFQPFSAVVDALRESKTLDVVDDDKIQRKTPLPEALFDESGVVSKKKWDDMTRARSIYAKGFGDEEPSTQFDIEAFFAPYGPTNAIRLRRKQQNMVFKGSVFVEFDSVDTAKAFLALENKPKWHGKELSIMSKEDYVNSKEQENTSYDRYTDEYNDGNSHAKPRTSYHRDSHRSKRGGSRHYEGRRDHDRGRDRDREREPREDGKRKRDDEDAGEEKNGAEKDDSKRAKVEDEPAAS